MISRRQALQGLSIGTMATAAMALQAPPTRAAAGPGGRRAFDPTNTRDSTLGFLKFVGSQGDEIVRRWFTGKVWAFFPGEPIVPLFYSEGFYLGRFWRQADGTHRSSLYEITFKRDLETGRLLEKWKNPFTGRTDTTLDSVGGPQERIYNEWGWDRPEQARGPGNPRLIEWTLIYDHAWFTWDLPLRMRHPLQPAAYPLESSGEMLDLLNLTNYIGRRSDLEDPAVLNAPSTLFWNGVTGWQPWMRMGQRPGALVYKSVGVKVKSFADLPKAVFTAGEARYPGCLTEKIQWPDGEYMWADYARQRFYQE